MFIGTEIPRVLLSLNITLKAQRLTLLQQNSLYTAHIHNAHSQIARKDIIYYTTHKIEQKIHTTHYRHPPCFSTHTIHTYTPPPSSLLLGFNNRRDIKKITFLQPTRLLDRVDFSNLVLYSLHLQQWIRFLLVLMYFCDQRR